MARITRIALVALGVSVFVGAIYAHFRIVYEHSKRLCVVEEGRFYRSGQLTAPGLADAVKRYNIRTVLNVQDDFPDPDLQVTSFSADTVKESLFCKQLGVNYVWLAPDLQPRSTPGGPRPLVLDEYLALLDEPENYPILIHCKAGLHRTGVLSAVYRMEYQGWSHREAFRELKAHGFGDSACTRANDYVNQYVLTYKRRTASGHTLRQSN